MQIMLDRVSRIYTMSKHCYGLKLNAPTHGPQTPCKGEKRNSYPGLCSCACSPLPALAWAWVVRASLPWVEIVFFFFLLGFFQVLFLHSLIYFSRFHHRFLQWPNSRHFFQQSSQELPNLVSYLVQVIIIRKHIKHIHSMLIIYTERRGREIKNNTLFFKNPIMYKLEVSKLYNFFIRTKSRLNNICQDLFQYLYISRYNRNLSI